MATPAAIALLLLDRRGADCPSARGWSARGKHEPPIRKGTTTATKTRTTTAKRSTKSTTPHGKLSQMQAAMKVLRSARKPMSCKEIVEAMTKKKLWTSPGGATPDATLYASILRDLKKGKDARFKKAATGKFTLAKKA